MIFAKYRYHPQFVGALCFGAPMLFDDGLDRLRNLKRDIHDVLARLVVRFGCRCVIRNN